MPRKAPSNVFEHRVTLGNYERQQLEDYIADQKINATLSAVGDIIQPFGQALGYGALAIGVAYGLNTFQDRGINDLWVRFTQRGFESSTGLSDLERDNDFITNNSLTNLFKSFWNGLLGTDY